MPVQRGPEELKDLPQLLQPRGAAGRPERSYEVAIFAEIVDAPRLTVDAIVERARALRRDGADVIDLGCLPETPFDAPRGQRARAEGRGLRGQRRFDGRRRSCCAAAAPAPTTC